ncbi:hypothetical protein ACFWTE_06180 [Nocardiopsis sp. NPDC058631]|uniref:hypothetical protein n=1 Tax=Nocardiopsis sp. NPDC058631 TaxID=3346566 RepID=UPI003647285D
MLTDSDEKISPATFPIPTPSPEYIESLAGGLRTAGESVADTGNDINSSWGALTSSYKAPEAEHLYTVLGPVAGDGDEVLTGLNNAANALENFAEDLRGIKSRWSTLRTEAYEFRARIDAKGDEWDKAEGVAGFFGVGKSPDVEENTRLIDKGTRIIEDYEEAERDCANQINYFVPDRTGFEAMPPGGVDLDPDVFYHGYEESLSGLATEWDMGGATTDEHWWVDAGHAVWDFGVGAVEGTGAMLGMHSSEGWFQASWGDALWEYHETNVQSLASLAGMYDGESDSWGWAGGEALGSAWKDLAHSVVPWEEWGERPGYVIGTAALNIVAMVGGAALTATGVGSVVGVPLMAWRGMAIVDGMGGRGGGSDGGSGVDVDVDLPAGVPNYGGLTSPIASLDASSFNRGDYSAAQLTELQTHLDRWSSASGGSDSSDPGGRPGQPGRPAQPRNDRDDQEPDRAVDPTTQQLADSEAFWDIVDHPDLAEVGRESVRDNQQRIDEVDREAKTDPDGGGGSWEANEIEPDRPEGPEAAGDRVLARVGGRDDGDTLTAERDAPVSAPDRVVDLTSIGDQTYSHQLSEGTENGQGSDSRDRSSEVTGTERNRFLSHENGADDSTNPRAENDRASQQKAEQSPAHQGAESHTAPGADSPGMHESATPAIDADLLIDKGEQNADSPGEEMPDNKSETNPTNDQPPEGEWSRSIIDSYSQEILENLPEPNRTPITQDGQRQQIPPDLTRGSILEELDMSRVELDDDGLISRVDGRDLTHFLLERLQQREIDIKSFTDGKKRPKILIDQSSLSKSLPGKSPLKTATLTQISRADLGGRKGGVYSLVIDRRTGIIAEGFNGRTSSVQIKPSELHPALKTRMDKMEEEGEYLDRDGSEMIHPHWDHPLRHAEVKAINELLLARKDARISDFQLDNRFIFKDDISQGSNNNPQSPPSEPKTEQEIEEDKKAPCCANCSRMTDGAPSPRMRKLWYLAGDPRNHLPRRST